MPDDLCHVGQVQHPLGTMFFGTVTSNRKLVLLIFVKRGIKINANAYVEFLLCKIKPWTDANFALGMFIWQQDSAIVHMALETTHEFLCQGGWDFRAKTNYPLLSLDGALLDHSIWDKVAGMACKEDAPIINTLKYRVACAWHALDANYISTVCTGFRRCFEAVITTEGRQIE